MAKKDLILLHGALGSADQFRDLRGLLEDSFNVHDFDFTGHGRNAGSDDDYGIDVFVDDTIRFIEGLGLEKASFFGYSMGGYVALKLAISHGRLVDRIVTLGTKFDWTPDTAAKEVANLDPDKIEENVPKFAALLAHRHGGENWKSVVRRTAQMMTMLGSQTALPYSSFKQVTHETLICLGEEDDMVTKEESEEISKEIPNASLEMFKDFRHPIEAINKKILADKITEFLK